MCGISAMFGADWNRDQLDSMVARQQHRGPDASGTYESPSGMAGLGHNRLSIIDLSAAGRQPMCDRLGRYWIVFNGEIYNYVELRSQLVGRYEFQTRTDTEVLLAAWLEWGEACLQRLVGMFAFVIWDEIDRKAFGARDRFGVKPLHYFLSPAGGLWLGSEIKALHAAGAPAEPDATTWATYLTTGMYDHGESTFWNGIRRLPPGYCFTWTTERGLSMRVWYDIAQAVLSQGMDYRPDADVADELLGLLEESVRLRFRADVPVGVCLSGGLDSSLLLGLVRRVQGPSSTVKTFTFFCDDPKYDELLWVEQMLSRNQHPSYCLLAYHEVPELASTVDEFQDEPYGGLPTLGMAKVHERARQESVVVLLDGNGLDEGWGGYDYYQQAAQVDAAMAPVQGARDRSTRPDCLNPEFAALAKPLSPSCQSSTLDSQPLLSLQYRDLRYAKIPRAMRFADRVSMMFGRELREPFLDHRIIELGLRQPIERKIRNGQGKWLVRQLAARILPSGVREAPKRPVQTPQREWLRGTLRPWLEDRVEQALTAHPEWFDQAALRAALATFLSGVGDNGFFVWQWLSAGMLAASAPRISISRQPAVHTFYRS